jgi:hypothetical protein
LVAKGFSKSTDYSIKIVLKITNYVLKTQVLVVAVTPFVHEERCQRSKFGAFMKTNSSCSKFTELSAFRQIEPVLRCW